MPNIFSGKKLDPDYIENTFNGGGNFTPIQPISIPEMEHTEIQYRKDGNNLYVKLIDSIQRDRLSIITLKEFDIKGKLYHEIKLTKSYIKERGYLKYLFKVLVIDYNYRLMSDESQSIPGSMNFWKKIKNLENIKCFIYKISTNYKRQYINQEDYKIWGLSEDLFIDDEVNTYAIEDLKRRKKINQQFYDYVLENQNHLKDCQGIRLIIEKK